MAKFILLCCLVIILSLSGVKSQTNITQDDHLTDDTSGYDTTELSIEQYTDSYDQEASPNFNESFNHDQTDPESEDDEDKQESLQESLVHPTTKCTCLLNGKCLNEKMNRFDPMCPVRKYRKYDINPCFQQIHEATGKNIIIYYLGDSRFGQLFSENKFIITHKYRDRVFTLGMYNKNPEIWYYGDKKYGIRYSKVKRKGIVRAIEVLDKLLDLCRKKLGFCPYVLVTDALYMLDAIGRKNYGLGTHQAELVPYVTKLNELHELGVRIIFKVGNPIIYALTTRSLPSISRMSSFQRVSYKLLLDCPGIMLWKTGITVARKFGKVWPHIRRYAKRDPLYKLPKSPYVHYPPAVMNKQVNILLSFICAGKRKGPQYSSAKAFFKYAVKMPRKPKRGRRKN